MGDRFRDFCQKFSNAYPGDAVKELRFLLHDHLSVGVLAEEHYSGMTLFNALQNKGSIAYNDVTIMSDIADVTENVAAKASVKKYKESVGKQYDDSGPCKASLSLQRKTLYEAMIAITENARGDLHNLIQFYGLKALGFTNKWDLVFHLEKELELNTQKKLAEFARQLHKGPRTTLLGDEDQGTSGGLHAANVGEVAGGSGVTGGGGGGQTTKPTGKQEIKVDAQSGGGGKIVKPLTTNLSEDIFRELLVGLSGWLKDEGNTDMLKLLVADFKEIQIARIQKAKDPFDLFKLLIAAGRISAKKIDLIIEAFSLCGWYGAENEIQKRIPSFEGFGDIEIKGFSQVRQNLIEFGGMLDDDKIKAMCDWNKINKVADEWDLLFQLDKKHVFEDMGSFINKLKRNEMVDEASVLEKGLDL